MKTEIRKGFRTGFTINEQELRRVAATIREQLKIAYAESETQQTFSVKFKNGSIAEPSSIDEIFSQENRGSEEIIVLQMKEVPVCDPECVIDITFDKSTDRYGDSDDKNNTVSYHICHNDKDWVFVTNSKIDERLSRIRRFSLGRLLSSRQIFMFIVMVPMLVMTSVASIFSRPSTTDQISTIQRIAKSYSGNQYYPIVKFISDVETSKISQSDTFVSKYLMIVMIIVMVVAMLFGIFAGKWAEYLFPSYNFLWGDYVDTFQRRKNTAYFVFVLIGLAIAVSVVANLISNQLLGK